MYRINRVKVQMLMLERWGTATQKALADRAGLTTASVSHLLSGAGFTAETLTKICRALDCTPNDILTLEAEAPAGKSRNTQVGAPSAELVPA